MTTPPPAKKFPYPGYYLLSMLRDPLRLFEEIAAEGPLVAFSAGDHECCLVTDPDLIKALLVDQARRLVKGPALERSRRFLGQGLLVSDGVLHQRQRRLCQPAFARQRITAYAADMVALSAAYRERWSDGDAIDVFDELQALTLRVVGAALFGVDTTGDGRRFAAAVGQFIESFPIFMIPYFEYIPWLPLPRLRRVMAAGREVRSFVGDMIRRRRSDPREREDLLALLMAAQDTDGDQAGMSDEQLTDECISLIVAGLETVASALTWTFHELAAHPAVEARLHAELDAQLVGRLPVFEDIQRLGYTGQVLAEAMRLRPPVWAIVRRAIEEVTLGQHQFPVGTIFVTSQWIVHRDPRFYADPRSFDPEHFSSAAKRGRPRFAFFPFGAGPTQCIGDSFAWTESVLVLATLAQRFRLRTIPGQTMRPKASITLRPTGGRLMRVERR